MLAKDLFKRSLDVFALRINKRSLNKVLKVLKRRHGKEPSVSASASASNSHLYSEYEDGLLLTRPHLKHIRNDFEEYRLKGLNENEINKSDEKKVVLLSERVKSAQDLPKEIQDMIGIEQDKKDSANGTEKEVELINIEIDLEYDNHSVDEVLRKYIPSELEIQSAFEQVGTLAHLNLRAEYLPWKNIIGQVIMDKSSTNIKTVVNKIGTIETEFRTFPMEVLAGDASDEAFQVEVKEHGFTYELDFRHVYWNSRLSSEHQRLVATYFKKGQIIVDVMAGVGPFAIPAAHKGCIVYANDLNPHSYQALMRNIPKNKVQNRVHPFNLDGREFIRRAFRNPSQYPNGLSLLADHVVMNLPGTAIEFLDAFCGAFVDDVWKRATDGMSSSLSSADATTSSSQSKKELPMVHCYCFTRSSEYKLEILSRIHKAFNSTSLIAQDLDVSIVRDVAPNKVMCCAHFRVPEDVAFGSPLANGSEHQENVGDAKEEVVETSESKKLKLE